MKLVAAIAGAIASLLVATTASAQDWPTRPITWVVPFPPGGVTDNGARTVAIVLSEKLGQPVIIEKLQKVSAEVMASAAMKQHLKSAGLSSYKGTIASFLANLDTEIKQKADESKRLGIEPQ